MTADFELAPFLDTGQVFNSFKDVSFQDYRMTPGVGFRAIVRPNVVGRLDYGYSREGGKQFCGFGLPLLDAFNAVSERPGLLMRHISYLVWLLTVCVGLPLTVGAEGLVHFRSEIFRRWINWSGNAR